MKGLPQVTDLASGYAILVNESEFNAASQLVVCMVT